MKKWKKINLFAFIAVVIVLAFLRYVLGSMVFSSAFEKPWHLLPSVHEDSLSQKYLDEYRILNKKSLFRQMYDSSQVNVFILVDAWGVPIDETLLESDFSLFKDIPHKFALHQRLANRTKHAERVEFRNAVPSNVYLFGGDSTEYARPTYVREIGFDKVMFCQKCNDSVMISKLDFVLVEDSLKFVAWTSQSSRLGDRDSLQMSLRRIADFAKRHPGLRIIVQGTHRPVLGTPETRNAHKSHWVPVVILN